MLYCHFQSDDPFPRSIFRELWERYPETMEAFRAAGLFVIEFEVDVLFAGIETLEEAEASARAAFLAAPGPSPDRLLFVAHTSGHLFRELADQPCRVPAGVFLGAVGYIEGGVCFQATDGTFVHSDVWPRLREYALLVAKRYDPQAARDDDA